MIRTTFGNIAPGCYFRSIYTKALFVKRTEWYAEAILLTGLADTSSCIEFGNTSEVDLLDCESEWPEIDYRSEIAAWAWSHIESQVKTNIFWGEEQQPYGSSWVGTVFGVMPSGKVYAFWTSNQTPEDVNRDRQFMEVLEALASEKGLYIDTESGDIHICKSYTFQEVAEMSGYKVEEHDDRGLYIWKKDDEESVEDFDTEEEAWEDCCRTNNLIG